MATKDNVKRVTFSSEEKIQIMKAHHLDRVPVSKICEERNLKPSVFYHWQQLLYDRGAIAFDRPNDRKSGTTATRKLEEKIQELEKKLAEKDKTIVDAVETLIALKKKTPGEN
jgi:transposase-like protein